MSSSSREAVARDKRRSRLMGRSKGEGGSYVPPALDSSDDQYSANTTSTNEQPPSNFVTAPPPVRQGKITSGISMLFRRPSSKEPGKRNRASNNNAAQKSNAVPPVEPTSKAAARSAAATLKPVSTTTAATAATSPKNKRVSPIAAAHPAVPLKETPMPPPPKTNSRLFYSSQLDDDDSEDSYESRLSNISQTRSSTELNTTGTSTAYDDDNTENTDVDPLKKISRYRGFSTSIKHLFLDEQLVCASIGCFGLILSQRTEYLLNLRNERRGVSRRSSTKNTGKRAPSRIVGYGLLITLFLLGVTFVVWGFGSGQTDQYAMDYYDGVDYDGNDGDDVIQYYNDDDDNNYYGNDDGYNNNKNNDDGYNNNKNNNNAYGDDDGGNNNNNNNNAYGDDDGNNNAYNDDGNNNNAYGDDNNNDDDGNRRMEIDSTGTQVKPYIKHPVRGVFKIRDYQEGLWEPICTLVKKEWYREDDFQEGERDLEDAGYNNYYNDDYTTNNDGSSSATKTKRDIGSKVRICLIFAFFVLLGVVGRRRRMRTRYALVRARAQEDHLYFASEGSAGGIRPPVDNTREDQYEGACSHTLCGCYPVDPPALEEEENDDASSVGTPTRNRKKRKYMDCVARGFQCLLSACCGTLCKCWCQFLSVCALAQEAREVRLLVPPRLQRIDFITHQPFHEYQKDVNDLRKGWLGKRRPKSGILPHIYALSQLSRYIVMIFTFVVLTIVLTLIFNPRASFSWNDGVVLIATFVQSFLVLYIIHWVFHKSDLSLDAVIKFFAAGFIIATPSAFLFEGLLVNLILMVVYSLYALIEAIQGEAFVNWVVDHYAIMWIVGELFNAYVVAAVTEELCKYYTFRTVEHPDLIFLTGLDRKHHEHSAVDGGVSNYSFAGHQVSDFNQRVNSFKSESEYSRRSSSSRSSRRSRRSQDQMDPSERMIDRTNTAEEFYEDDHDVRTYRQQAAAVTTGMISVAVGLACAENFLYVFLLGGTGSSNNPGDEEGGRGGGVLEEWIVLFFRSIFPIHALAAAMQSVNMIRKFVECTDDNSHNIGVGRIILPAVILHGSFDAVLMGINVFVDYSWDQYLEENDGNAGDGEPYNPVIVNFVAWTSIIVIMLTGVLWYYRENRKQRLRLIILEEREKAREAEEEDPYINKSRIPRPTDIELV